VVGFELTPATDRCWVNVSTPKMLLDSWLLGQLGYGTAGGQEHVDHTFKLLQEQVPMIVTGVHDIQQHGRRWDRPRTRTPP
jgi:hypothetical protein